MPFVSTDQSTFYSDQNTYRFTVRENSPSGTVIGKIQFQGSGDGTVYYTLLGPDTDKISLGPDGTLTLRSGVELDFETTTNGQILVRLGLESPQGKVLLKPLYVLLNIRDMDDKPSEMSLSSGSLDTALDENGPTTARKLADITFTDDASGTNTPELVKNPGGMFEVKQDSSGAWSLWLNGGVAAPDFETNRQVGETRTTTIEAVIGSTSSGIGDEPAQKRYEVTIRNVAEFTPGNHADVIGILRVGQELRADTSGITSADGKLSFTYSWESPHIVLGNRFLSKGEGFEPDASGRYSLKITATAVHFSRTYSKTFTFDPAIQSAGSRGDVFQRPPDDVADDGLNDPLHDDLPPPQMDVV